MITITLPKEFIDEVFEEAEHQSNYAIQLYKAVVPDWEKIANLNHSPTVSKPTSEYLFKKAIAFDKEYHPDVFSGGHWMNIGFGADPRVTEDWVVVVDDSKIDYKEHHYGYANPKKESK